MQITIFCISELHKLNLYTYAIVYLCPFALVVHRRKVCRFDTIDYCNICNQLILFIHLLNFFHDKQFKNCRLQNFFLQNIYRYIYRTYINIQNIYFVYLSRVYKGVIMTIFEDRNNSFLLSLSLCTLYMQIRKLL